MHLVDLAGSERVSKTRVLGTILSEAKHINLSLHFLEQVIICLQVSAVELKICESVGCNSMQSLQLPCTFPPVRLLKRCVM